MQPFACRVHREKALPFSNELKNALFIFSPADLPSIFQHPHIDKTELLRLLQRKTGGDVLRIIGRDN